MSRPTLSPYTFSTIERTRQYLKRPGSVLEDNDADVIVEALNHVGGLFDGETGRKLACRTYRNASVISCTSTIDTKNLTAASGLLALKTLDDAYGANLTMGSRIDSITSDTALVLTKNATASGAMSVTFGSEPLVINGTGSAQIYIPVRPVVEVYTIKWVDSMGTKTDYDLTGARLDRETGLYVLMSDAFPRGTLNIEIECKAGYREPTATDRGDWSTWAQLEGLCHRAVQVMFQDFAQAAGRTGEINLATASMKIMDFKLPDDIKGELATLVQPW